MSDEQPQEDVGNEPVVPKARTVRAQSIPTHVVSPALSSFAANLAKQSAWQSQVISRALRPQLTFSSTLAQIGRRNMAPLLAEISRQSKMASLGEIGLRNRVPSLTASALASSGLIPSSSIGAFAARNVISPSFTSMMANLSTSFWTASVMDLRSFGCTPKLTSLTSCMAPLFTDFRLWSKEFASSISAWADMLLPPNLRAFGDDDWSTLVQVSVDDGLVLAYAPRPSIVRELLDAAADPVRRAQVLADRREELLEDVEESLNAIDFDGVKPLADMALKAVAAVRAGCPEAALSLVTNVLDRVAKEFATGLQSSYVSVPLGGKPGVYKILSTTWGSDKRPQKYRQFRYLEWIILAGMLYAFAPQNEVTGKYNRHAVSHFDPDAHREEYVIPAFLITQGLLRHWEDVSYVVEDEDDEPDAA